MTMKPLFSPFLISTYPDTPFYPHFDQESKGNSLFPRGLRQGRGGRLEDQFISIPIAVVVLVVVSALL